MSGKNNNNSGTCTKMKTSKTASSNVVTTGSRTSLSKGFNVINKRTLPDDFVLGEKDVICGRGSYCFNWIGNQRFRAVVASQLQHYRTAKKRERTTMIHNIVNFIRYSSPNGGFVKLDSVTKKYYEVGDFLAREKTSQAFRDLLCDKYRSSNKRKKELRSFMKQEKRGGSLKTAATSTNRNNMAISITQTESMIAIGPMDHKRTRHHFVHASNSAQNEWIADRSIQNESFYGIVTKTKTNHSSSHTKLEEIYSNDDFLLGWNDNLPLVEKQRIDQENIVAMTTMPQPPRLSKRRSKRFSINTSYVPHIDNPCQVWWENDMGERT